MTRQKNFGGDIITQSIHDADSRHSKNQKEQDASTTSMNFSFSNSHCEPSQFIPCEEFLFTLRTFKMSDYDKVYQLWKDTPGVGLRNIDDSREGIERFITRNPNTNFVAEEDGKIVGVALSGHDGRRGYLYHVCVADTHRRRCIGKLLVQKVTEAMKAENITALSLFCFTDNEAGNTFWSSLGWTKRPDLNCYRLDIIDNNE